jgi:predicted MPP superfamily phosphohydrolase
MQQRVSYILPETTIKINPLIIVFLLRLHYQKIITKNKVRKGANLKIKRHKDAYSVRLSKKKRIVIIGLINFSN